MQPSSGIAVYGRSGLRGTADTTDLATRAPVVRVHTDHGADLLVPAELLQPRADEGYDLLLGAEDMDRYRTETISQQSVGTSPRPVGTTELTGEAEQVIPVAEERLKVEKRRVESGKVVIRKTVHEHEETVDVPLVKEEVEVERVPVNRYIDQAAEVRQEGDETIIPIMEEVLVVEKKLLLREEVHIRHRRSEEHVSQKVGLRREEVHIERSDREESPAVRR